MKSTRSKQKMQDHDVDAIIGCIEPSMKLSKLMLNPVIIVTEPRRASFYDNSERSELTRSFRPGRHDLPPRSTTKVRSIKLFIAVSPQSVSASFFGFDFCHSRLGVLDAITPAVNIFKRQLLQFHSLEQSNIDDTRSIEKPRSNTLRHA